MDSEHCCLRLLQLHNASFLWAGLLLSEPTDYGFEEVQNMAFTTSY